MPLMALNIWNLMNIFIVIQFVVWNKGIKHLLLLIVRIITFPHILCAWFLVLDINYDLMDERLGCLSH